jgi:DNA-binding GntR family transcriptional regulator
VSILALSDDLFVPIYVRIQERIRTAIAEGALAPGDRVWSEAELAGEFHTTRSTVRHALDRLVFEGLIVRQVGRGSFVAARGIFHSPIDSRHCLSFEEQAAIAGHVVSYRAPSLERVAAPQRVAQQLGVGEGDQVFKFERVRVIAGRPVCLEIRYLPHAIGCRVTGDMLSNRPAHTFVGEILGERIPTIVVSITAEIASPRIAEVLELPEGSAVTVRSNTHHASSGAVVLCGRSVFAGDISTDYVLGREPAPVNKT